MFLEVCITWWNEKGRPKKLFYRKISFFFQKIRFSAASQVIREKIGRSRFSSTRKIVFFFKKFFRSPLFYEDGLMTAIKKLQKNLCPVFNCKLMTIIIDRTRKHSFKKFVHWKLSFSLKPSAFQQLLSCYRKNSKTCTRIKWTLCEA